MQIIAKQQLAFKQGETSRWKGKATHKLSELSNKYIKIRRVHKDLKKADHWDSTKTALLDSESSEQGGSYNTNSINKAEEDKNMDCGTDNDYVELKAIRLFMCIPPRLMWQEQDNMSHQWFKYCGYSVEDKFVSLNYAGESGIFGHKWHILDAGVSNELYMCVCAHKRRRIFGHTRHILEAGGRDREQIKNRSPLHQSVGLETRGGKLVDEELGEGGGG